MLLRFFDSFSSACAIDVSPPIFGVSYLVDSWKLAESEGKGDPDSVLSLLRSHGFTDSQISSILRRKLQFLHFRGASSSELCEIVSQVSKIFGIKKDKAIIVYYKEDADKSSKFKKLCLSLPPPARKQCRSLPPPGTKQVTKLRPVSVLREQGMRQRFLFPLLMSGCTHACGNEIFEESLTKVACGNERFEHSLKKVAYGNKRFEESLKKVACGNERFEQSLKNVACGNKRFDESLKKVACGNERFDEFLTKVACGNEKFERSLTKVACGNERFVESLKKVACGNERFVESLKKVACGNERFEQSLACGNERFEQSLVKVVEMGFDPTTQKFVQALCMLYQMNHTKLEEKFNVFKRLGLGEEDVWAMFKKFPNTLTYSKNKISHKTRILKRCGLLEEEVCSVFKKYPPCIGVSAQKVANSFETFLGLGFSRDEFAMMVKRAPSSLGFSPETVKKKTEFLVKEMNWPLKAVVSNPQVLGLSMEKRIVPRCNVIKALLSKGLIGRELPSMSYVLVCTGESFLKRYVRKHDDKQLVAELMVIFAEEDEKKQITSQRGRGFPGLLTDNTGN